jgi:iron only hydrogenase large subunit-like protein/PAS domain-containing protein
VKAIRMREGQAFEVAESCLACGTCIRECPQGAKSFRQDLDRAMAVVAGPGPTAISVAPSFAALFNDWERRRLPSALRRLGFGFVSETAVGAYHVACATAEYVEARPGRAHVVSACPAVVRYVEGYRPKLIGALAPVVSPMAAHGRHLKARLGPGTRVVFVGPCVAKKMEAERPGIREWVDVVLTFVELQEWLRRAGIELGTCEESGFDEAPAGAARLFPLVGGSLRTSSLDTDVLAPRILSVSGFEEVREALDGIEAGETVVLEPLFCRQGCINGPAMPGEDNVFHRREAMLDYARLLPEDASTGSTPGGLGAHFTAAAAAGVAAPVEAEILRELERTGKGRPEDQLNCGACGYASCRDKAVAVLRGMAETEMCLPFMRRRAEQRTDRILETSPNGIVILDERLAIISMNPAFRRYFMCSEAVCGKRVSYLMDPHVFEQLVAGETEMVEAVVRHEKYNLVCHQIAYALREEKQYVGIFVNISHSRASQEKLTDLRARTVVQARQLLDHQVTMARKITEFLGESAAQGEVLVEHLRELASEGGGEERAAEGKSWLHDIYTSKP